MSSGIDDSVSSRLHGGWMEHKSTEKNKYTPLWAVLKRDGTLFFFTSEDTSLETHIGTLRLGADSTFQYGPRAWEQKEGFRFDLLINRKRKKFRVNNQYDRELWRAYVVGVTTGKVPQDSILSPQDLRMIDSKIHAGQHGQSTPPPSSSFGLSPSSPDLCGSASSMALQQRVVPQRQERRASEPSVVSAATSSTSGDGGSFDPPGSLVDFYVADTSHSSSDSGVDNSGGPFMKHNFGRSGNIKPPSWFFEDCNRELAIKIVSECRQWGNTLMRISSSAKPSGSYVITKRLESSNEILHYEIIRVSEGYTINAQNITKTMKSLPEVMEFFIRLSGPETTHPMASNDLKQLGVEYDPYERRIFSRDSPATNIAVSDLDEPDSDYEVPATAPPPPPCSVPPPPHPPPGPVKAPFKTWNKDKTGGLQWQSEDGGGSAAKTLGPAQRKQIKADSGKPSVMQLNQTLQEQDAVANLDSVLMGEERKLVAARGAQVEKRPPLPTRPDNLPKLCTSSASSGYVNDGSDWPGNSQAAEAGGQVHQRWNQRSQSVPMLLNCQVSANITPPMSVKPGGGQGSGGEEGREKVPPPTTPKPGRSLLKTSSVDQGATQARDKAMPNILTELQQKLRIRVLQTEHQQQQQQQCPPAGSHPEKTPPAARAPPHQQEDDELYEDVTVYQNVATN